MERKYLKNLIDWNNDEDRKPLLVLGARQAGKSYLVEELYAKKYYKNFYLRIDCFDNNEFVDYVLKNSNLKSILEYLQIKYDFIADNNHLLMKIGYLIKWTLHCHNIIA